MCRGETGQEWGLPEDFVPEQVLQVFGVQLVLPAVKLEEGGWDGRARRLVLRVVVGGQVGMLQRLGGADALSRIELQHLVKQIQALVSDGGAHVMPVRLAVLRQTLDVVTCTPVFDKIQLRASGSADSLEDQQQLVPVVLAREQRPFEVELRQYAAA